MIRELVAQFPNALPCRIRAGLALTMIEELEPVAGDAFSTSLPLFVDLAWVWVEDGLHELAELHRAFETMHASLAGLRSDLDAGVVHAAQAVFLGAYCVVWEAYSEALDEGRLSWSELPGEELREGDLHLWLDWADALHEVEPRTPPRLERDAAFALHRLRGDAADRRTRIDRARLHAMLQERERK